MPKIPELTYEHLFISKDGLGLEKDDKKEIYIPSVEKATEMYLRYVDENIHRYVDSVINIITWQGYYEKELENAEFVRRMKEYFEQERYAVFVSEENPRWIRVVLPMEAQNNE